MPGTHVVDLQFPQGVFDHDRGLLPQPFGVHPPRTAVPCRARAVEEGDRQPPHVRPQSRPLGE
ncbi:hypothetical protein F0344_20015 [Streptomyces finlayi]|uniref:Uncharacterized protein n=1 Tax=Streptomyces finlayi TaxID=67296 RepID=A0A7G7BMP2_9ACTN|nr:hypothetical protein [Streptomyces finlayi]QNE76607.1 hypothetical protein F0344_20015 [Streptomyces finlayi]